MNLTTALNSVPAQWRSAWETTAGPTTWGTATRRRSAPGSGSAWPGAPGSGSPGFHHDTVPECPRSVRLPEFAVVLPEFAFPAAPP